MTHAEIKAALQAAFEQCDFANCSLTEQQKQILLRVAFSLADDQIAPSDLVATVLEAAVGVVNSEKLVDSSNPLDVLTPEQRRSLLQFLKEKDWQTNQDWKIQLLNDWFHDRDSGPLQFIREIYGPQWLEQIQPTHLAYYYELEGGGTLQLKVGDRIEVTNGLWEWVQEDGPCRREWLPCTVVGVYETSSNVHSESPEENRVYTTCVVRFDNGTEYEVQGVYQWNQYNWRWPQVK